MTFLVIASDDRSGDNGALGGESPGMRSDTTMLVHLSGDRTRVDVVSIPRDTLVDVPACPTTHGEIPARSGVMFNSAFAFGWDRGQDLESAAACTVRAAEAVSGVRMDGFVVVDFAGFVAMVDALEGVPITLDQAIDAPEADLLLPAGPQVLDGRQALGLARARSGAGLDGSDLRRIDRQHDLVDAMTARLVEQDLLTDAPRLLRFLDAATSSQSASPGLSSLQDLAGIAMSLDEVAADDVVVLTPEVARAPSNKNRVVFTGGRRRRLGPSPARPACRRPGRVTGVAPGADPRRSALDQASSPVFSASAVGKLSPQSLHPPDAGASPAPTRCPLG